MSYFTKSTPLVWRVAGLAALTGARSMAAPALLSRHLNRFPSRHLRRSRWHTLQSSRTANLLTLLATGEMIGDKLPAAPDRISPGALVGRSISGAVAGAVLFKRARQRSGWGATVGAVSALTGAYATFYLRKRLSESTYVPDPVWGGIEDLLVIKAGQRLLRRE